MKKYSIAILVCILLSAFILGACSNRAESSEPSAEVGLVDTTPTADSETADVSTDEENSVDDLSEEENPVAVTAEAETYCVDCHTDQQALIDTAKPEEEVISENEGAG
jgi:PBP1b-binding outer membrane lipoprotein LpoB